MKLVIVIPTYNEKENIRTLIPEVTEIFGQHNLPEAKILVVDDGSPDGTAEEVNALMNRYKDVILLQRDTKQGLGSAYVAGFKYAMDELNATIIFEMDGDGSHDPKDIVKFLDTLNDGYEVILGSRYVKGGVIPNWKFHRRVISKGGNLFARIIAGIPFHDCTSGYRAIKVDLLNKIDLDKLNVSGYAFQISLLHALVEKKAKIKEIPITFRPRWSGESKLGKGDVKEFFITAFKLRLRML
jgi:dolichol-phosphate mannosyltransferase